TLLLKRFETNMRFSGICLSYNISMLLFGSTAPIIAVYISKITNDINSLAYYLMAVSALTIFSFLRLPKGKLKTTMITSI
ncbi:hypothetical protein, partial [Piscirickettsia litoralis]|uniref:hypothetical protein n=1 Tax=Piscirickettsia litoralis TaxID=1891921 RepID=UPI00373FD57A